MTAPALPIRPSRRKDWRRTVTILHPDGTAEIELTDGRDRIVIRSDQTRRGERLAERVVTALNPCST